MKKITALVLALMLVFALVSCGETAFLSMSSEQYENGELPHVIPDALRTNGTRNSTAWDDAACIIPWELYCIYGDKQILADSFEQGGDWFLLTFCIIFTPFF